MHILETFVFGPFWADFPACSPASYDFGLIFVQFACLFLKIEDAEID
jgi:hypothetical protein